MGTTPEHVYLVTVDGQWPVDALADDNPGILAGRIDRAVKQRMDSGSGIERQRVHVFRARLVDVVEVELVPERVIPPTLVEKS